MAALASNVKGAIIS